jgi:hypothetical protein
MLRKILVFLGVLSIFGLLPTQTGQNPFDPNGEPQGKINLSLDIVGKHISITKASIISGVKPVLIGTGNSMYVIYGPNDEELFSGRINLPVLSVFEWADENGDLHGFAEPFEGALTLTLPYFRRAVRLELFQDEQTVLACRITDLPFISLNTMSCLPENMTSALPDFRGFVQGLELKPGGIARRNLKNAAETSAAHSPTVRVTVRVGIEDVHDISRVRAIIQFGSLVDEGNKKEIVNIKNGTFRVKLKPGKYLVKAYGFYLDPDAGDKEVKLYPRPIIIPEFDTSAGSLDITWKKNVLFQGQLVNKSGRPIQGDVLVFERNQNFRTLHKRYLFGFLTTDAEGRFAVRLPPKRFPMLILPFAHEPAGEMLKIVRVRKRNRIKRIVCPRIKTISRPALNKIWDSGPMEEKLNIVFLAEAYTDGMEAFEDLNRNGVWDGDLVLDENGNGMLDEEEYYYDRNWNGFYEEIEPFTDENGDGVCNRFERARFEIECASNAALLFNYKPFNRFDDVINIYSYWVASTHGVQRFTKAVPWQEMQTAFGVYCEGTGDRQRGHEGIDAKAYVNDIVLPGARETVPVVMLRDPFCLTVSNARLDFGRIVLSAEDYQMVLIHELGHSIGNLHDEYLFEGYPFMPPATTYTGPEPVRANVTIVTDPTKVKWSKYIKGMPLVPTPIHCDGYGIFEGAGLYKKGIYRPTAVSMMRRISAPFFAVNSEQLAKVLSQFRR